MAVTIVDIRTRRMMIEPYVLKIINNIVTGSPQTIKEDLIQQTQNLIDLLNSKREDSINTLDELRTQLEEAGGDTVPTLPIPTAAPTIVPSVDPINTNTTTADPNITDNSTITITSTPSTVTTTLTSTTTASTITTSTSRTTSTSTTASTTTSIPVNITQLQMLISDLQVLLLTLETLQNQVNATLTDLEKAVEDLGGRRKRQGVTKSEMKGS
ncbi:hypothetical protein Pmani_026940 [Petrolisthes manimaculis]|uniref:Uncharacterized protein n=1 Tax=Petrolisthes manimaculis TaxID=1843537 RepID=A0AAE1P543_9EUCA|nr:hypothetical protein Pmani_026940 [Petrolisthes manimaculis]